MATALTILPFDVWMQQAEIVDVISHERKYDAWDGEEIDPHKLYDYELCNEIQRLRAWSEGKPVFIPYSLSTTQLTPDTDNVIMAVIAIPRTGGSNGLNPV